MSDLRQRLASFGIVRAVWLTVGALLVIRLALAQTDDGVGWSFAGLLALTFPAGYLPIPTFKLLDEFPIRIAGVPSLTTETTYGVLMLAFGYLQWFVVIPRLVGRRRPAATRERVRRPSRPIRLTSKTTVRNVMVLLGLWEGSRLLAFAITLALIPLTNRVIYEGDVGTVLMWISQQVPEMVTAAAAGIVIVWLLETEQRLPWVVVLTALYLYSGALDYIRLRSGFHLKWGNADRIGIAISLIGSAACCAATAGWKMRRGEPKA